MAVYYNERDPYSAQWLRNLVAAGHLPAGERVHAMTHIWRIRKWLPERYGQPCRIIATGSRCSALVEFSDGARVVTCRRFLRKK